MSIMKGKLRRSAVVVAFSLGAFQALSLVGANVASAVVTTNCSVSPRARMTGAPKAHNVRHSLASRTISADTVTTMERPIKSPATKLPACRNFASRFFTMHGFES